MTESCVKILFFLKNKAIGKIMLVLLLIFQDFNLKKKHFVYLLCDFPGCDEPNEVSEEGVGVGGLRVFAKELGTILECRLKQKIKILKL